MSVRSPIHLGFDLAFGCVRPEVLVQNVQKCLLSQRRGSMGVPYPGLLCPFAVVDGGFCRGAPPTLVAGIYGMNFKNMPELSWDSVPRMA